MSNETLMEARRKLDSLQEDFSRVTRDLEAIWQDTTLGSRADRINALYDEAGQIVDEWRRIWATLNKIEQRAAAPDIEQ